MKISSAPLPPVPLIQALLNVYRRVTWENLILAGFVVLLPIMAFYNLEDSPRTWHDEGAAMSVARTLVEDGVYAVRNSDGYQTFGPVQSVGPTVILPVALSFRIFGVGLVQGRAVVGVYSLLTLLAFYWVSKELFNKRVAILSLALLIGTPSVYFFKSGRSVLGEVPALGFFLVSLFFLIKALRQERISYYGLSGLFMGLAMITKMTYLTICAGALGLVAILDLVYYRQKIFTKLILLGAGAGSIVAAWTIWQVAYLGMDTFLENASKLGDIAANSTGFNLSLILESIKSFLGPDAHYFYYWWGIPALLYSFSFCIARKKESIVYLFLLAFIGMGLANFLYSVPWAVYTFALNSITAIFVGKLLYDIIQHLFSVKDPYTKDRWSDMPINVKLGSGVLIVVLLIPLYDVQNSLQFDVFSHYPEPQAAAEYLSSAVPEDAVVETWERELGILSDHNFHYPDQSMLSPAHLALYRDGSKQYRLGAAYFNPINASYLVVGWFARKLDLYDPDFLANHARLVKVIGTDFYRYEVYQLVP